MIRHQVLTKFINQVASGAYYVQPPTVDLVNVLPQGFASRGSAPTRIAIACIRPQLAEIVKTQNDMKSLFGYNHLSFLNTTDSATSK